MEQQEVSTERELSAERSGISNKVIMTVAALSALLTFGIVACGSGDSSPAITTVRSKNAAITTTTCLKTGTR